MTKVATVKAQGNDFVISDLALSGCVGEILAPPKLESANRGFLDRVLAGGHAAQGEITLSCEKSFKRLPMAEVIV